MHASIRRSVSASAPRATVARRPGGDADARSRPASGVRFTGAGAFRHPDPVLAGASMRRWCVFTVADDGRPRRCRMPCRRPAGGVVGQPDGPAAQAAHLAGAGGVGPRAGPGRRVSTRQARAAESSGGYRAAGGGLQGGPAGAAAIAGTPASAAVAPGRVWRSAGRQSTSSPRPSGACAAPLATWPVELAVATPAASVGTEAASRPGTDVAGPSDGRSRFWPTSPAPTRPRRRQTARRPPAPEGPARCPRILDEEAVAAVRQWRYEPTLVDGEPVSILLTVTVNFALRDDRERP